MDQTSYKYECPFKQHKHVYMIWLNEEDLTQREYVQYVYKEVLIWLLSFKALWSPEYMYGIKCVMNSFRGGEGGREGTKYSGVMVELMGLFLVPINLR